MAMPGKLRNTCRKTFKTKSALANADHPERVPKAPAAATNTVEPKKQEVSV